MYSYLLCREVTLLNPNSIRYDFAFNALVASSRKGLVYPSPILILLVSQKAKNAFLRWRSCTNSCEEPLICLALVVGYFVLRKVRRRVKRNQLLSEPIRSEWKAAAIAAAFHRKGRPRGAAPTEYFVSLW